MIAEGHDPVADDLAGFMTLAGDQQDIAGPQLADGAADRLAPVANLGGTRRGGKDRGADRRGDFAARIIVGDDHPVGFGGGDGTHQGPLATIAIAARAKHDDETAGRVGTQGVKRLRQGVGLVRIVDEDLGAAAFADAVQTATAAEDNPNLPMALLSNSNGELTAVTRQVLSALEERPGADIARSQEWEKQIPLQANFRLFNFSLRRIDQISRRHRAVGVLGQDLEPIDGIRPAAVDSLMGLILRSAQRFSHRRQCAWRSREPGTRSFSSPTVMVMLT